MTKKKVTRKQLAVPNKRGAGRPKGVYTVQLNRRVPLASVDKVKALVDNMLLDPELIQVLLVATRDHIAARRAHSPHS